MESLYNKVGISSVPGPGLILLGIDANGKPLYGTPELANNSTPDIASKLAQQFKQSLTTIGAATPEDVTHLEKLSGTLSNPQTLQELDSKRALNDKASFSSAVGKLVGGDAESAKAAYDAWGVMSPNQKAVSLLHINGKTLEIKQKEFLPGVDVNTAINLQDQGIPMAAVRGNWQQIDALHSAIGHEGDTTSAIKRAARSGQLGSAQTLTPSDQKFYQLTPAPQYGLGALEMPQKTQIPKGYSIAGAKDGKQVIVPQGNEASVAYDPKYNGLAGAVYNKWSEANKRTALNGSQGGSNMYKTLTTLYDTNPKALGAAVDTQIPGNAPFADKVHGLAVKVLTTGDGNNAKAMTKEDALKAYGAAGIQNKEIGYKLANQAYAEGRINDSHLFAIQRGLDDTFNNDQALAHISPVQNFRAVSLPASAVPVPDKKKVKVTLPPSSAPVQRGQDSDTNSAIGKALKQVGGPDLKGNTTSTGGAL